MCLESIGQRNGQSPVAPAQQHRVGQLLPPISVEREDDLDVIQEGSQVLTRIRVELG